MESVQVGAARSRAPPPRPPPLPSTFSFLPEREGGASRPSPLPPTPAVPGHFCCLETFPPRGHSGPSPSWVAGGTDGLPAQDPGACLAQALHSTLIPPSGTRRGNSRHRGHPRPSRGAPSQACCGGGGDADSGPRTGSAGGCRSRAAVQCPNRAPRAAGALGEEGALQNGGAREAAAVGVLATLPPLAPRPEELLDCAGIQHHHPSPHTPPVGKAWPQTNPGSS